ncbi:hypothetical protein Tco_0569988 [Tanacetum coccineum]
MVEPEPVKKMSKKELLRLDEELAFKLQANKEEERLAQEKAQQVEEANIGWKPKSLKNKSFANIQELFDKAMKRVNTFVDYKTELESSKKAEAEIAYDEDDVTIDATPLSTKSPTIVDYKIYKEGKKSYF